MPIVESVISSEIVSFMTSSQDEGSATEEDNQKIKSFADSLASVIANAIKSADIVGVTTNVSTAVVTTGTAAAQSGTGTGTGTQTAGTGSLQ
jgi:hypothetical protein